MSKPKATTHSLGPPLVQRRRALVVLEMRARFTFLMPWVQFPSRPKFTQFSSQLNYFTLTLFAPPAILSATSVTTLTLLDFCLLSLSQLQRTSMLVWLKMWAQKHHKTWLLAQMWQGRKEETRDNASSITTSITYCLDRCDSVSSPLFLCVFPPFLLYYD